MNSRKRMKNKAGPLPGTTLNRHNPTSKWSRPVLDTAGHKNGRRFQLGASAFFVIMSLTRHYYRPARGLMVPAA